MVDPDDVAEVWLPKMMMGGRFSSLGKKHSSVVKNSDEMQNKITSMQYYTTYIRKVNELSNNKTLRKRQKYQLR